MTEWPAGLDFTALLAPISAEVPAGVDPRADFSPQSMYLQLRDARSDARDNDRLAEHDGKAEGDVMAKWAAVRRLAQGILAERAKDLEVAAWLTEALVRSDGLNGVAAGVRLMAELADRFWDGLLPMPDEDGIATRVAPIAGLNGAGGSEGTLMQPLRRYVLLPRVTGEVLSFWEYERSEKLEAR